MAMAMSTLLSLSFHSPKPPQKPNTEPIISTKPISLSRRLVFLAGSSTSLCLFLSPISSAETKSLSSFLSGISNTKSWFQFYGDGFSIRVPPQFEDLTEPEDYNAGLSLYGDKAKPKKFAARFASSDRSEVLSVVIRPSNQLKITFLEAKDITDLGSLKEAAKIFVPVWQLAQHSIPAAQLKLKKMKVSGVIREAQALGALDLNRPHNEEDPFRDLFISIEDVAGAGDESDLFHGLRQALNQAAAVHREQCSRSQNELHRYEANLQRATDERNSLRLSIGQREEEIKDLRAKLAKACRDQTDLSEQDILFL
ncbi:uncharacterized protein LOC107811196 isoform X2 [Nicotiana tabacum]|uniref:Uncharacterized protein LOC107811196 isoform X2 n=1 Tax=Nicotiana tabacum TaxID=4097 RepID=A0AC58SPM0_TOBAC